MHETISHTIQCAILSDWPKNHNYTEVLYYCTSNIVISDDLPVSRSNSSYMSLAVGIVHPSLVQYDTTQGVILYTVYIYFVIMNTVTIHVTILYN